MKKILFFSCEPGGAEVLIPVIQKMIEDKEFELYVIGYGFAVDRFKKKNIVFDIIEPIQRGDFYLFNKYNPDFIVTSATSLPQKDMSEKYLWYNAKRKSIPTIAFLDQWQNYTIRFSGITEEEYLLYQPDFINCINDIGKKDMMELGFKKEKLIELGQPYLSSIEDSVKKIDKSKIKSDLKLDDSKEVVLFVSEAIEEHFGNNRGYTQYTTIEYLLNQDFVQDKQVVIKLHPKDNIDKFKKYKNIVLIQNSYTSLDIISIADYVVGMTSIMLIEAYILKKSVLSLQLKSNQDLLLLSREHYIKKITDKIKITDELFVRNNYLKYQVNYKKIKDLFKKVE